MSISFQPAKNSQARLSDVRPVGLSDPKFKVLAEKIDQFILSWKMESARVYIESLTVEKIKNEYKIEVNQDEINSIQSTAFETLFQAAVLNGQDDYAKDVFRSNISKKPIRKQAVIMKIALVALFRKGVGNIEDFVLRVNGFIPLIMDQIREESERDYIFSYLKGAWDALFLPNPNISTS